ARSAAFTAPGSPMASVPTGTPLGICTIESRESSPLSVVAGTGTPSTGSTVFAATIPGRCAAPPAAAMITSIPRDSADDAYSNIQSGVRCAETIFASCGTSSSISRSIAGWRCLRSDLLPMMTPTQGALRAAGWCVAMARARGSDAPEIYAAWPLQGASLSLVDDHGTAFHHPFHTVHRHVDVGQRIAVDGNDVGRVAWRDAAQAILHAENRRAGRRGGGQRLCGRHADLQQLAELARILAEHVEDRV